MYWVDCLNPNIAKVTSCWQREFQSTASSFPRCFVSYTLALSMNLTHRHIPLYFLPCPLLHWRVLISLLINKKYQHKWRQPLHILQGKLYFQLIDFFWRTCQYFPHLFFTRKTFFHCTEIPVFYSVIYKDHKVGVLFPR